MNPIESRIPGFYRLSLSERRAIVARCVQSTTQDLSQLLDSGGLNSDTADKTVENAIGTYSLPLGLALNFRVNDVDRLVPMVVEEPSVIAAACNAARLARRSGGFSSQMLGTWMTGQVEVREVESAARAIQAIVQHKSMLLESANAAVPGLVARGAGVKDLEVRDLGGGTLVVHFYVDCQDAMGANLVNGIAESLGPEVARISGGRLGLRILTNLCDRRRVAASCRIALCDLADTRPSSNSNTAAEKSGRDIALLIVEASRFAMMDPYRAATHNKGIMNGIDAVVLATGNDFRAAEAGAHAWAARTGSYSPLSQWTMQDDFLVGNIELPLALGIVGGTIRVHPTAKWAVSLLGVTSATELSEIVACVGLASNFSSIRALATEGIQRGHMSLHARSVALSAGAADDEVETVARLLVDAGKMNESTAKSILEQLRLKDSVDKMTFDSNVPYSALLRPELSDLKAYLPDQNNYKVRLDANEAPPFQSEYVYRRLNEVAASVIWERYPDPSALELREALANRCGALADEVLVGVGSDELIALLLTALSQTVGSHNPPTVLTVSPTFVMYKMSAKARGFRVLEVPLDETWDLAEKGLVCALQTAPPHLLFIASPNNPTGNLASRDRLERLLESAPNTVCVVNEAYIDYADRTHMELRKRFPNLILLRTLSKIGFAGLRVGWLVGPRALVNEINKARQPYNLASINQALAKLIVTELSPFVSEHVHGTILERQRLSDEIRRLRAYTVSPSDANFLWVQTSRPAQNVFDHLRSRGILVRSFHERGGRLAHQLRITIGSGSENDRLLEGLAGAI